MRGKIPKIVDIGVFNDGWQFMYGNGNFNEVLDKYSWQINDKKYEFNVKLIKNEDVLYGKINNFDAILVGAVDQYVRLWQWKLMCPDKYSKWIKIVTEFIRKGGGYAGHCGGANLICELYNEPETFLERAIKVANFGITGTKVYQKGSIPLLDQLTGHPPTAQEGAAYMDYDGFKPDAPQMGGIPIDFIVKDRNHPILKGYNRKTLKIFWGGGPGLIPSNKAKVLLSYPKEEISELYPIHVWEYVGTGRGGYTGKWIGVIKSIIQEFENDRRAIKIISRSLREMRHKKISVEEFIMEIYKHAKDEEEADEWIDKIANGIYKAKDWRKLNQIMPVKRANMAAMVTEEYGDGRIVISGPHPEDKIWDNGRIIDVEDTKDNCLWEGFMRWIDYKNKGRQNRWLLRREAAWVAGLDEDELPPIPEEYLEEEIISRPKPVGKRGGFIEALIRFFRRLFGR